VITQRNRIKGLRLPHTKGGLNNTGFVFLCVGRTYVCLYVCVSMHYVLFLSAGARAIMTKLLSLLLWPRAPTNLSTAIKARVHFSRVKFGALRQNAMKWINALGKIGRLKRHSSLRQYTHKGKLFDRSRRPRNVFVRVCFVERKVYTFSE
jgi:hypothetical protein